MPRQRNAPRTNQPGAEGPLSTYLTAYSTPEDKRSLLERQIEADLAGTGLDLWEDRFCQWLALQPMNGVPRKRQLEVASVLAGRELVSQELVQLRLRPVWRKRWSELRDFDTAMRRARTEYAGIIEDSPRLYRKMLAKVEKDEDARAATPLLVPLLERAVPKKEENAQPAALHVHLSIAQAKGLDQATMVVESEEIVPEFTVEDAS